MVFRWLAGECIPSLSTCSIGYHWIVIYPVPVIVPDPDPDLEGFRPT